MIDLDDPQEAAAHLRPGDRASLELVLLAPLPHVTLGQTGDIPAIASPARRNAGVTGWPGGRIEAPVYVLLSQPPGAQASGPAVIEGPFFTMLVPAGWQFATTAAGDLRLTDRGRSVMRIPMTEYLEIDLPPSAGSAGAAATTWDRPAATTRKARWSTTVTHARSTGR